MVFSTFASHLLVLEPKTVLGMGTPQQTETGGKTIRFENNRAYVPEDWIAQLEQTQDFKENKVGYSNNPLMLFRGKSPLETVRGAMTRTKAEVKPPIDGWDEMPDDELRERIDAGDLLVSQLMACMAWEASHRRRAWVIVSITEALEVESEEDLEQVENEDPPAELDETGGDVDIDPSEMPLNIDLPAGAASGSSSGSSDGGLFS